MPNNPSPINKFTLEKQTLRKEHLQKRLLQEKEIAKQKSKRIAEHILSSKQWNKAATVALYMPIKGEVLTRILLQQAWDEQKKVYLPRCCPNKKGEMHFVLCHSQQNLCEGTYEILEPCPELAPCTKNMEYAPELILVPGVAFDKKGARIGFGGGYYDRMLTQDWLQKSIFMGLAYEWQVVQHIPMDFYDIKLHAITTEEGILWI